MKKERFKSFLSDEEYKLLSMLVEISEDNKEVVTCNNFDDEEYIFYDGSDFIYRTNDDILIGDEAIDVVDFFKTSFSIGWFKSCRWYVDEIEH